MTTPSKPKKFRLRKSSPLADSTAARPDQAVEPGETAGTGSGAESPRPDNETSASGAARREIGSTDLSDIRREGLTGRQLRMARRLAQKNGITVTSDFEAVQQLRMTGIDPFERSNMLELVVPAAVGASRRDKEADPDDLHLPQTVGGEQTPSTDLRPPSPPPPETGNQISELREIQRDIARRRRRKLALLVARLAFFVGLPTFLAGFYYYRIATPMYATNTEFVIQQAESAGGSSLGGLFSGTGFATSQDAITVQSYLTSRDAMLRLNEDAGFKTHFSQPHIDPIQRLEEGATNEEAYGIYTDKVKIGYDPTEGIIKMEVIAAAPETSAEYSRRLIDYAEERVDALTQRLREDQMSGARESFQEAEEKMLEAQQRVLDLQEQLGVLDPSAESGAVMGQVATFETQLSRKRLELQQLLSNASPSQARVSGVRGDIERLEALIVQLRSQMTDGGQNSSSLASVTAQLRVAETDLATRTSLMQQSLAQLETARIEANRQVRYLSLGVTPIPPDEATYPRAFENTLLALLIFSGIYLMLSLTASILREQVSS